MTQLKLTATFMTTALALLLAMPSSTGQSVCLPLPRLLTTKPMGAQVGTTVEIEITGDFIEDARDLLFSHPEISAVPKLAEDGQIQANRYLVTVSENCPAGLYEARVMSRLGLSAARFFSVGTLPEVVQSSPNTSLNQAMKISVDCVCNAAMSNKSVDYFSFNAVQGQRYIIHCAAKDIDSKLNAVLIVADEMGRDLIVERRGGAIDFTAPNDGTFVIKVHELTFKGGPEYFYRLTLRKLHPDEAIPQFAATRTVSSFSWPPEGLPEKAAIRETEPNPPATAQKIELPCDISGSFFPAADVDAFEFTARKDEVWWIEVASERLGRPTDPSVVVQRVTGEGEQQTVSDVAEYSDIPSPVKVSSNGYAYDGPPYNGGSADIIGKLEVKEDGLYRLQITDLFGGTRTDDRNIYRLIIRKAQPDFALISWAMHMELRNGDRNALSKPIALRAGATMALEVVAVRRDGFDGPIELKMHNLPDGVTAEGLTIPAGKSRGIMLITASQEAPRGMAFTSFTGKAMIGDKEVTHAVSMAAMAWPVRDAWQEIPSPRLVTSIPVSVTDSEVAPISIAASEQDIFEVKAGEKLNIPLMHTRRDEFSGSTLQLRTFGEGFENVPRFDIKLTDDASKAVIDTGALKTAAGDYTIAFYGSAVAKYRFNPSAVTSAETRLKQAEELLAALDAELKTQTTQTATVSSESGQQADELVTELTNKMKAAEAVRDQRKKELEAATKAAAPKDTAEIVVTEPIHIRVLPAD
ncbi:MAG: serine protease [Planctomycetaceae bacterium]|nr:serine protease [Planctomycetaceae bacterium]